MLVANAWRTRSDAASSLVVSVGIVGNLLRLQSSTDCEALIVGLWSPKMGWGFSWDAARPDGPRAVDDDEVRPYAAP